MSLFLTAIALQMAASAALPADEARIAFSNCMVEVAQQHLGDKNSAKMFGKVAQTACADKKTVYRDIIITEEKGFGSSDAEAAEYADEEVKGIVDGFVDSYGSYLSTNTRPVKE